MSNIFYVYHGTNQWMCKIHNLTWDIDLDIALLCALCIIDAGLPGMVEAGLWGPGVGGISMLDEYLFRKAL